MSMRLRLPLILLLCGAVCCKHFRDPIELSCTRSFVVEVGQEQLIQQQFETVALSKNDCQGLDFLKGDGTSLGLVAWEVSTSIAEEKSSSSLVSAFVLNPANSSLACPDAPQLLIGASSGALSADLPYPYFLPISWFDEWEMVFQALVSATSTSNVEFNYKLTVIESLGDLTPVQPYSMDPTGCNYRDSYQYEALSHQGSAINYASWKNEVTGKMVWAGSLMKTNGQNVFVQNARTLEVVYSGLAQYSSDDDEHPHIQNIPSSQPFFDMSKGDHYNLISIYETKTSHAFGIFLSYVHVESYQVGKLVQTGNGNPMECPECETCDKNSLAKWDEASHQMGLGKFLVIVGIALAVLVVVMLLAVSFAYAVHRFYSKDKWVPYANERVDEFNATALETAGIEEHSNVEIPAPAEEHLVSDSESTNISNSLLMEEEGSLDDDVEVHEL